jgi:hypothetical protein
VVVGFLSAGGREHREGDVRVWSAELSDSVSAEARRRRRLGALSLAGPAFADGPFIEREALPADIHSIS